MSDDLVLLTATAATIGLVHTLLGPDHYLPFVVLAKARSWSVSRTAVVTAACGVGHVAGSVVLGTIGIAFGVAIARLEWLESARGNLAAWLLIAFGLVYTAWGLQRALRKRPHRHVHTHDGEDVHVHHHAHVTTGENTHRHLQDDKHNHSHNHNGAVNLTPWVLFTIFVLGPCEPLIPLLMYPATKESVFGVALVATTFGFVTIAVMLAVVLSLAHGLQRVPTGSLERFSDALAGLAVLVCGIAVHLGL
jgi:sulfite exporter TauE/SafE